MLIKAKVAIAAGLLVGAGSIALAAYDDQHGGFRELGSGGAAIQGVNPANHPSLSGPAPARPQPQPNIQTEGRGSPAAKPPDKYGSEAGKE